MADVPLSTQSGPNRVPQDAGRGKGRHARRRGHAEPRADGEGPDFPEVIRQCARVSDELVRAANSTVWRIAAPFALRKVASRIGYPLPVTAVAQVHLWSTTAAQRLSAMLVAYDFHLAAMAPDSFEEARRANPSPMPGFTADDLDKLLAGRLALQSALSHCLFLTEVILCGGDVDEIALTFDEARDALRVSQKIDPDTGDWPELWDIPVPGPLGAGQFRSESLTEALKRNQDSCQIFVDGHLEAIADLLADRAHPE